ncbi:MAG: aldehyde dehydrogenase family protein [Myxococcota bacterium]|nr:aldehyde dehydrogenase family protein [Myxococcota bacterium]
MSDPLLTIDGRRVAGDASFRVTNPATGEPFAEAPECSPAQLDAAMEAAGKAFASWAADEATRREALVACGRVLAEAGDRIAPLLTREQGKPIAQARSEIERGSEWFARTAALEIPKDELVGDAGERIELRRKPLGVVAAITPWNFPVILAIWKIASALRAGNTLVLKPSPFTPLATLLLGELLQEVLPPGVLNVVSGGDQLGARVSEHPAVRKVSFTGSVATGKKIMAAAAPDLKRVTLELGGNDPAIVLADADPAEVAPKIFQGAFRNSGQICIAIKRVYAEEKVVTPLVEALIAEARKAVVGDGMEPETTLGPINNRPQYERVCGLLESARGDGGTFVTGGEPLAGGGYFVPPALVTGLEDGSRLVDEEQFGPVLPILSVRSAEEAIERANATHFGLGGSVWSPDTERALALAARLECGTGWVNQHGGLSPEVPFGGRKWSGIGYENGRWGLESFSEIQTLVVSPG